MLPTHNLSRLIIQESSSLSGRGEMHKNLHTVVGLFLWTILGGDIRVGHFFNFMSVVLTALNAHTFFLSLYSSKWKCYGNKCFSTYQAVCSWLKKKPLSEVSVSVSPPREIYFVEKVHVHLYSKELYNISDSPTYVEYRQTL